MKKQLLFVIMLIMAGTLSAQETLTGWTFPANSGADSLNANLGTTQNKTYDLRFQWVLTATTDSTLNTVTFVQGATTYAAATTGWENGANIKFWSIKFKANNYSNFKVSSKQKSDATNPGPRDFKLQWRLSSGTYADIDGGSITLGADWTTGVLTDLPVPITGQGTSSIYLRWIMASNTDINGGTVASSGQSMIDDILVTGVNSLGQNEILYTNRLKVYPSHNNGNFTISSTEPIDFMSVVDLNGKTICTMTNPGQKQTVTMSNAKPGLYLLKVRFSAGNEELSTRFIVE
ncbi:MAG: T9SS type A sorting domain-containing protein [Bacteroidetes bacterium]|nr:T9SS type A sorting domain-containing protein [Bacteroidota bacterium]